MSTSEVDLFKAYLLTNDPRLHPSTLEKQAAIQHDFDVRLWKSKLAGLAQAVGAAPGQLPPVEQMPPADQMHPVTQRQPDTPGGAPSLMSEMDEASEDVPTYDLGQKQAMAAPSSSLVDKLRGLGVDKPVGGSAGVTAASPYFNADGSPKVGPTAAGSRESMHDRLRSMGVHKGLGLGAGALGAKGIMDQLGTDDSNSNVKPGWEWLPQHALKKWFGNKDAPGGREKKPAPVAPMNKAGALEGYADGYQKTARCGHPNNVAFARSLRPGMFPGMDENRGMRFRFTGDFSEEAKQGFENAFKMDPSTRDYLYGQQKRAEELSPDLHQTQHEDLKQDGQELGIAIKEQKITTDPKMEGNEKEACSSCGCGTNKPHKKKKKADMVKTASGDWWFNHV